MKYILLVNSSSFNQVQLDKLGLSFRAIINTEYNDIIQYLNNLVTDEMEEKVLSFRAKNFDDTYLSYQIALIFHGSKISFMQEQFLKMIVRCGSKTDAIQEFVDLKSAVVCETTEKFNKYFQDYEAVYLINSVLGFVEFVNSTNQDKKRLNLTASIDDFISGNSEFSLSFYQNGLSTINSDIFTNFIAVLNTYDADYQFYFLNNLMNMFSDENPLNATKIILDDISIIEFLLINENDDKKKSFTLKCGVLCRDTFEDETNSTLKMRLEGLYEIRNHLIHGSTQLLSRLESKYGHYLDLTKIDKESTLRTRHNNLLISSSVYLDFYLIKLFSKFIFDNDVFRFVKDN